MSRISLVPILAVVLILLPSASSADDHELQRLIGALVGNTPQAADLAHLADVIGGRTTGTPANEQAVDWALGRFHDAGVQAGKESFTMPRQWLERESAVTIRSDGVAFTGRAVAKQFSPVTGPGGLSGPVVDVGMGSEDEFRAAGAAVEGAWVLVETAQVVDLAGLFGEYEQSLDVEPRAERHGVLGIIYQSPRAEGILHRLVQFTGVDLPIVFVERQNAQRMLRLARTGRDLEATVTIDAQVSGEYVSHNVVAEIPGTDLREEIVLVGAHLDSHGLGTGAIDDGGNATVLMDIARQITRLGLKPRRTIRIALWNGEEQGFIGSWNYTRRHADELDRHVMAASIDTGEGLVNGFFTNGRGAELRPVLERVLAPVAGLGPFAFPDAALVGTDNYDFLLNGVANLIGSQASTQLGPHYHADTDTLDKVDPAVMKRNAAILAALIWGFANEPLDLPRQSAEQVEGVVEATGLVPAMKMFGVYDEWVSGERAWQ